MDQLTALNPEQREAVLHIDGPLLILAGAGSGKTRVIAQRIAYLLSEGYAQHYEILAVTFTNKAAEEMRTRVETLLGTELVGSWISTFHALCARLLRREATAIGLPRDFVIYDSSDQVALVKHVLKELQIDDSVVQPRMALSKISHAKNTMAGPEFFKSQGWSQRGEQLAKVYDKYIQGLKDNGALDFDDLLLKAVELLDNVQHVREKYAEQFRFVMVDEYQDTNRPQYRLIERLAERHRNLAVVGDPDQSIYRWRGADLRNILDFEHDFPEARIVKLERNYRSTQVILDAASAVIGQNKNRKEKRLWTERKGGDLIKYFRGSDELEEADFIMRTAHSGISSAPDCSVAVLYRTNAQSRVIEDSLMRAGLTYRVVGGVRFYERKEIKDSLAFLKLLINPHDDVSLRRVINVPPRGNGKGVLDAIDRLSADEAPPLLLASGIAVPAPNSLWTKLNRAIDERLVPQRAVTSLRTFRDLILGLADIARKEPLSITLGKVLDQTGYLQDLREDKSEDSQGRIENLMELVSAAREYRGARAGSLAGRVYRQAVASLGSGRRTRQHGGAHMAHDAACREGPRVSNCRHERARRRSVPAFACLRRRRRDGRRAAPLLRWHDARTRATGAHWRRAPARLRRVSVDGTLALHGRGAAAARRADRARVSDQQLPELVRWGIRAFELVPSTRLGADGRASTYHRAAGSFGSKTREESSYSYEDEDQSSLLGLRLGAKVRHPQFGIGTILSVEELADDVKLVVRFSVGPKTLRAKYAKLELA